MEADHYEKFTRNDYLTWPVETNLMVKSHHSDKVKKFIYRQLCGTVKVDSATYSIALFCNHFVAWCSHCIGSPADIATMAAHPHADLWL